MLLIVDFGSQTAHLISRRLHDLGATTSIVNPEEAEKAILTQHPQGIILSGGPASVYESGAPTIPVSVLKHQIPVLGICYGWQLMAHLLGGEVRSTTHEYGPERIHWSHKALGVEAGDFMVIVSHGDSVTQLPTGFEVLGSTEEVAYAAVANSTQKLYGVQFHPEAYHTENGIQLLEHFAIEICGESLTKTEIEVEPLITKIKEEVGEASVICAVSGGVDSTVAATLMARGIGQRLIPVFVDSGLMRDEARQAVIDIFQHLHIKPVILEAREEFMAALKGKTDAEEKRKIIGKLYVDLFQREAEKHQDVQFLGQGTIYSDVIESKGSKHASHIKSHHNVGGLPPEMKLKLLEPLRTFYKDQVKQIGRLLGLPEPFVMQQTFPGPGFAIRIRGEVTEDRLAQVKQADTIVIEELRRAGLYDGLYQCFALMTGAYSTAVKGDGRAFAEVVALRAYESIDVMTSRWAHLPYDVLGRISNRIVNEVPNVSRVVYDISTKPPATMEWE